MTIRNRGKHAARYESDPVFRAEELAAAEVWDKHAHHMEYVLSEQHNERGLGITPRDMLVAATVIQWLGSPVGRSCLDELHARVIKAGAAQGKGEAR